MKTLGWIRIGDKAACGGTVAEGFEHTRFDGVPYSFQGAKMNCPQGCVIAEGASIFRLASGRLLPHHGHRTSGGCPLHSTLNDTCGYANSASDVVPNQYIPDGCGGWTACSHDAPYDLSFLVRDEHTGHPLPHVPYRIDLGAGRGIEGMTDASGRTEIVWSDCPEHATLTVPYYGNVSKTTDSGVGADTCDC